MAKRKRDDYDDTPTRSVPGQSMAQGKVRSLITDRGFGFITGNDGSEYFFHRSDAIEFDALTLGSAVLFNPGRGPKGPRADNVTRVDN